MRGWWLGMTNGRSAWYGGELDTSAVMYHIITTMRWLPPFPDDRNWGADKEAVESALNRQKLFYCFSQFNREYFHLMR